MLRVLRLNWERLSPPPPRLDLDARYRYSGIPEDEFRRRFLRFSPSSNSSDSPGSVCTLGSPRQTVGLRRRSPLSKSCSPLPNTPVKTPLRCLSPNSPLRCSTTPLGCLSPNSPLRGGTNGACSEDTWIPCFYNAETNQTCWKRDGDENASWFKCYYNTRTGETGWSPEPRRKSPGGRAQAKQRETNPYQPTSVEPSVESMYHRVYGKALSDLENSTNVRKATNHCDYLKRLLMLMEEEGDMEVWQRLLREDDFRLFREICVVGLQPKQKVSNAQASRVSEERRYIAQVLALSLRWCPEAPNALRTVYQTSGKENGNGGRPKLLHVCGSTLSLPSRPVLRELRKLAIHSIPVAVNELGRWLEQQRSQGAASVKIASSLPHKVFLAWMEVVRAIIRIFPTCDQRRGRGDANLLVGALQYVVDFSSRNPELPSTGGHLAAKMLQKLNANPQPLPAPRCYHGGRSI
jgi:hypothetical protein